eukprot:gene6832-8475_t
MSKLEFDSKGNYFANINKDNRITVFDPVSSKITHTLFEKDQINNLFTCLTWFTDDSNKNKKKLIIAGTEKGDIIIYDIIQGKNIGKLTGSHSSRVNDLVVSKNGDLLYSCDSQGGVVQWDLNEKKKLQQLKAHSKPVNRITLSDDSSKLITTGSSEIKIWDVSSMKTIKKLKGHTSEVVLLSLTKDSKYLLSSSKDRFINIYSVDGDKSEPVSVLSCDSQILSLTQYHGSGKQYLIAGVTESNFIALWQFNSGSLTQSSSQQPASQIKTDNFGINSAILQNESTILISVGKVPNLIFKQAKFIGNNKSILPIVQVQITESQNKSTKESSSKESTTSNTKKEIFSTQGSAPEVNIENTNDLPPIAKKNVGTDKIASTGTVVDLITQSLRNSDEQLLYRALKVNIQVIQNTVKELPSPYAYSLLTRVLKDLAIDNDKSHFVLPWITTIIKIHSSYLISVPNLSRQLSILNSVIEDKFLLHEKLSKLVGKFELIEGHSNNSNGSTTKSTTVDYDPSINSSPAGVEPATYRFVADRYIQLN